MVHGRAGVGGGGWGCRVYKGRGNKSGVQAKPQTPNPEPCPEPQTPRNSSNVLHVCLQCAGGCRLQQGDMHSRPRGLRGPMLSGVAPPMARATLVGGTLATASRAEARHAGWKRGKA